MRAAAPGRPLPVLLPAERPVGRGDAPRLQLGHGACLAAVLVVSVAMAGANAAPGEASIPATMLKWTPLLARGFLFNLAISALAMTGGTLVGGALGIAQISLLPPVRAGSWVLTQFFRNAPWLVLLFFCMYLLPFEVTVAGVTVPLPDWVKATAGLSLPVMANVSEIVRGAVQSIPGGQWESAASLAFTRWQTLRLVILPQCVKRMLPPWMNLYAILTMATVLASIVGVSEVMTLTSEALGAENRTELLVPMYAYVLLWFFAYCYPIARWTVRLERRFAVQL